MEAGRYKTLRPEMHGGDSASLVREDNGGERVLYTPGQAPAFSGPEVLSLPVNLKVEDNDTARLLVDIDLRRALVRAPDGSHYVLLPALRFKDQASAGWVGGTVAQTDLDDSRCTSDLATDEGNAVHVYAGDNAFAGDVFVTTSAAPADTSNPVTVVAVTQDSSGGLPLRHRSSGTGRLHSGADLPEPGESSPAG